MKLSIAISDGMTIVDVSPQAAGRLAGRAWLRRVQAELRARQVARRLARQQAELRAARGWGIIAGSPVQGASYADFCRLVAA